MDRSLPVWIKAPFIRLLLPLSTGIYLQWQFNCPVSILRSGFIFGMASILAYSFLPLATRFRKTFFAGTCINFLLLSVGALLLHSHDIRNDPRWFGKANSNWLLAVVTDPPVRRPNSFRATASIMACMNKGRKMVNAKGRIILYFSVSDTGRLPTYGSCIFISKQPARIRNAGNPGETDYAGYCLYQGITHQAYLDSSAFLFTKVKKNAVLNRLVMLCRNRIVQILRQYIQPAKERGLAEALLIGYKDDLDPDLVRSYSETGVVHVIAISGMHLALVYGLLVLLTRKLNKKRALRVARLIIVLSGLWLFSLMAGAQASVMRSTVMFTCIAFGELLGRKTSIYNTLSLSAFMLLCYQPFWLWDAGFQLSYAAVLSIVLLYRPVYGALFFPHKLVDAIWKTAAVSIAAQVLTTPVSLYYFHQFPVLFLFTNLVAVPLSSLIVFACIFLCLAALFPMLAHMTGFGIYFLIKCMNQWIEKVQHVPFSLYSGIQVSAAETLFLFLAVFALMALLSQGKRLHLYLFFLAGGCFIFLHSMDRYQASRSRQLIVYNARGNTAVHLIARRKAILLTDSIDTKDPSYSFGILPSVIKNRIDEQVIYSSHTSDMVFAGKTILLLDGRIQLKGKPGKADLVIITGKNDQPAQVVLDHIIPGILVTDASVPAGRRTGWKEACSTRKIPYYSVADDGAFVMKFQPLPLCP
jgi:competence protein ComEC